MNAKLKILMLEDSLADAEMIKHALIKSGISFLAKVVDTKSDFEDAITNFAPDLILSDHSLPNFNSIEALKITRSYDINIPFILVTGAVSEEFAVECMKAGADDYILKSSLLRLPSSIEKVFSKREMKFERERLESFQKIIQSEYAESLKKANKELESFAYIVSHDLKAPLRAIANLSQWIEEDLGEIESEDVKKNLALLRGRTQRMESLINGILEYSRVGRVKENNLPVNVKSLLTEVIDSISPPSTFKITIGENMPTIQAEKVRLQQVFTNLINNAVKHNDKPSEGIINIDCNQDGDNYCFSVSDNGPGIEKKYHEKVFQIFQTLAARDEVESTGIGLAIVKKIVEDQGGKIWIESETAKGSKFLFTWKASASQPAN